MTRYRVAIVAYFSDDDEDHAEEQLEDAIHRDFKGWCYTVPVDESNHCLDEVDLLHVGCSR